MATRHPRSWQFLGQAYGRQGARHLISKDQVGTGDNGSYDKAENKVTLTGNVTFSQGTNVTKGDGSSTT